jgi:hypothetical protein
VFVVALAVPMSVVLPWIDSRVPYRDEAHKGGIAALTDRITLVPAAGWNLTDGALPRPHALARRRHRHDGVGSRQRSLSRRRDEIVEMIRSIRVRP